MNNEAADTTTEAAMTSGRIIPKVNQIAQFKDNMETATLGIIGLFFMDK